ncbi:FkbM family methyltransferase [Ilumatobacter sp.]|uniref:FkbM family methyltransferase n=1 Tax=Ilumatobacter sp. TaxID=1967498 RepID=UPI003298C32E
MTLELLLPRLMFEFDVTCLADVGANDGRTTAGLRKGGYSGEIVSFEPDPAAFSVLASRAATDLLWRTHQTAIGRERNEKSLILSAGPTLGSFLPPDENAIRHWNFVSEPLNSITVPVQRLDSILPELVDLSVLDRIFLKMDIQGWDLEAFAGATGLLEKIVIIQTNLSLKTIYDGQPTYREQLDVFEAAGFEPAGFFPWPIMDHNWALIDVRTVFVRQGLRSNSKGTDVKSLA